MCVRTSRAAGQSHATPQRHTHTHTLYIALWVWVERCIWGGNQLGVFFFWSAALFILLGLINRETRLSLDIQYPIRMFSFLPSFPPPRKSLIWLMIPMRVVASWPTNKKKRHCASRPWRWTLIGGVEQQLASKLLLLLLLMDAGRWRVRRRRKYKKKKEEPGGL